MTRLLLYACLLLTTTALAQTPADSVQTEFSTEPAQPAPDVSSQYKQRQQEKERDLMSRSRQETTLFRIGLYAPIGTGGVCVLREFRPKQEERSVVGLLVGVDHKFSARWGGHLSGSWLLSPRRGRSFERSPAGIVNVGVDYYPLARRNQQKGYNPNNFYRQLYLTTEGWFPFNDRVVYDDNGTPKTYHAHAYKQAVSAGLGFHSSRTRWYYYQVSFGLAYLVGRDPGLYSAVQPMARTSIGIGF